MKITVTTNDGQKFLHAKAESLEENREKDKIEIRTQNGVVSRASAVYPINFIHKITIEF